jgi:hypothetical protein
MAIPWLLGLVSLAVAVAAYRRNRLQVVRIHKMRTDCLGLPYHDYWRVELLCLGADVFELALRLECDHSYWHRGRRQALVRAYKFEPLGELPNPLKNGQIARFELGDHVFRDLKQRHAFDPRTPSQLWPGKVKLVAYHSGQRRLFSRSAWRFWRLLRSFDYLCRHPERVEALR